jgi:hypothetical protein
MTTGNKGTTPNIPKGPLFPRYATDNIIRVNTFIIIIVS